MPINRRNTRATNLQVILLLASLVGLSGCIHLFPASGTEHAELTEARNLAKLLKSLEPSAIKLVGQEHTIANSLRVTLESVSSAPPPTVSSKLISFVATLRSIRDQRSQLESVIKQGTWRGPMVHVIQHDAIVMMEDDISRSDSWIELLQNMQLRTDLGGQKDFPELQYLGHQLDIYLAQVPEEPLSVQVRDLQEEFRFRDESAGSAIGAPARSEKR